MEMTRNTTTGGVLTEQGLRAALTAVLSAGRIGRTTGYFHSDGRTWDVKTDSSCGWEIATPALRMDEDGHCEELRKGVEAIRALNPLVDRRCGLHVHVEVQDYSWDDMRRLIALWSRYEPFFYEMQPASRRNNMYCGPTRVVQWEGATSGVWPAFERMLAARTEQQFVMAGRGAAHQGALNIAHYWQSKRVEFRLHSGTCDYQKIRKWVALVMALVNRVKQTDMPPVAVGGWSRRGFTGTYLGRVLGLLPSAAKSDVHPHGAEVMAWADQRRRQFATPRPARPARATRAAATPAVAAGLAGAPQRVVGDEASERVAEALRRAGVTQDVAESRISEALRRTGGTR
jgi:hypothetical protein